jgi:hypothetical protein
MGKASSAKKVARAARAGGRVSSGQPRSLLFPATLTVVAVFGVSLVVYARAERLAEDREAFPQLGDHIHAAYGVNVCGEFQGVVPEFMTQLGIHTHSDGLIHVEPTSDRAVGSNAILERFVEEAREGGGVDISFSSSEIAYLGETVEEGKTQCEEVENPQIRMAYWDSAAAPAPRITTGAFGEAPLDKDGAVITLFYGDPDADIPKPPSVPELAAAGAPAGGDASTTTSAPADGSTTGADQSTTSTPTTASAG